MKFVHSFSHGSLKRSVNVIDGPVMPHPSSSTGKKIRVTSTHVIFTLDRSSGDWVTPGWSGISIGGVVLKKDGSEGKETWGGSVAYGWEKDSRYDWLRKLIEAMRPEGAPVLPFRLAGLENDDLGADHG